MKNKNLIRFVSSLVFLPVMSSSLGGVHNTEIAQGVLAKKFNMEAGVFVFNQMTDSKADLDAEIRQIKAEAIDLYFKKYDMPLSGVGMKMVEEAEKNEIDWRLLPAIAMRESTGGKFACKKVSYNSFGWGSCKIGFKSEGHAIEVVAKNLGGNNPKTEHYYRGKTTKEILRAYNPPSIVPKYAEQVISIMEAIGEKEITLKTTKIN